METRDAKGRFLPGHPGGPGRPTKEKENAILEALREAFTPEELIAILREALIVARKTNSARGMIAAIMPMLEYSIGTPPKRIQLENIIQPTDWVAAFKDTQE